MEIIVSENIIQLFKKYEEGDFEIFELNKIYNTPVKLRKHLKWFTVSRSDIKDKNKLQYIFENIAKIADENQINIYYEIDIYSKMYSKILDHAYAFNFKNLSSTELYRLSK